MFTDTMRWPELIETLLKEFRVSTYELQNKYGINSATLSNMRKGKSQPTQKVIKDIENALKIKIDDSDPENITYKKVEEAADNKPSTTPFPFIEGMATVNVYGFVHAGNEGPIFSEDVIEKIQIPRGGYSDLHGITVDGDSMEPTINNRDIVVVSLTSKASDGDVCLVAYNDHDYVLKRVFFNKDIDLITLVSDNKKYPPAFVPTNKIKSVLPVVWLVKGRNSLRYQG
ncbi:MAG TPA: XRE family transcriptional regulator [Ignavibacteriales bacterium]|nr:XRE family transcriptional regulator [Ignavibacteriales bacterium]